VVNRFSSGGSGMNGWMNDVHRWQENGIE
jgi:hypothetical protein